MDLTQFPEPLRKPFEDLVASLETIYRDNSVSLIKFLNLMVCKFGDVTSASFRDNCSQTEDEEKTETTDPPRTEDVESSEQVWDLKSLAEDVRSVAEKTLKNHSSFVYDSCSGTYYNHSQECYYIPEHKLYYYVQNKAYYTYDEDSNSLQFYSRLNSQQLETSVSGASLVSELHLESSQDNADVVPGKENDSRVQGNSEEELEEGEIVDEDDIVDEGAAQCSESGAQLTTTPSIITASPVRNDLNVEPDGHCAPCVRMTVRECESNRMEIGQLFIVTRSGGSLGREGGSDIIIADSNVSKNHLNFRYRYTKGLDSYEITDCGSRNGTYLDGSRLKPERAYQLQHGSVLKLGSTLLSCHIHEKLGTCEDCEPSCLGFMTPASPPNPSNPSNPSLKQRYNTEINQIKRKFGLSKNTGAPFVKGYEDRSKIRRETVGSSHESEKTEAASTETPLRSDNRGYALLSKMGWKEGDGVGKTAPHRSTSPVRVTLKLSKRGLGCPEEVAPIPKPKHKLAGLEITRKRYEAANDPDEAVEEE